MVNRKGDDNTMKQYSIYSEHEEQKHLMEWAESQKQKYPQLRALFAIPIGGHRHITIARRMKAEGAKAGVPDLMLPFPSNGYAGMFLEMKKRVGGRLSDEQKLWRSMLSEYGYLVVVAAGWEVAKDAIIEYLTTKPSQP